MRVRVESSSAHIPPMGSQSWILEPSNKKSYAQLQNFKLWLERQVKYKKINENFGSKFIMKDVGLEEYIVHDHSIIQGCCCVHYLFLEFLRHLLCMKQESSYFLVYFFFQQPYFFEVFQKHRTHFVISWILQKFTNFSLSNSFIWSLLKLVTLPMMSSFSV